MNDAETYWSPIIQLRNQLRCWVRVAWRNGTSTDEGQWGQLLIMPTASYLEGTEGPRPLGLVEWVELSTRTFSGGFSDRPLQFVDIKDEIVAGLKAAQRTWELRGTTWSMERVFKSVDCGFKDEAVNLIRIVNPFGPK